jgi:hypothetical protein
VGFSVVQYVLDNPTLGAGTRWDGVNLIGSFNGGGLLVSDARAVFVPLTARPAGGIGSGHAALDPGYDAASGAVHIAQLDIAVDEAAKPGGIAELRLEVGPLTIAHATAGTWAAEPVFFGFVPGGPEAATGSGAQAGATSVAADATIIVADECAGVADCADADDNGVRDEPCTWWACEAGHCAGSAVSFGDVGGEFGACPPDGAADANDRFHALNCFANQNAMGASGYPCEAAPPAAFNVDAGGPFGDCNPDGVCDGHDAFHALNAFDGTTSCSCPAPSPAPPAAGSRHEKRQAR